MRNKHRLTLLKKYNIDQATVAKLFGYSNVQSFRNSTAKDRILSGINAIVEHVEMTIKDKL